MFTDTTFKGKTSFYNSRYFKNIQDWTIVFSASTIEKPTEFKFDGFSLEKVVMSKTDWTYVEFLDCKWPTINKRKAVYDELEDAEDLEESVRLTYIEQLYNRLQKNFENAKQYNDAGDFYIGAMEMRRLQIAKDNNKIWRWMRQNFLSVMAWYRMVSLYGERYIRPLYWLAGVILLFPFFYLQTGFDYFEKALSTNPISIKHTFTFDFNHLSEFFSDYFKGFMVSLHAIAFQKEGKLFELSSCGIVVYILQSVLSATIITLFLLALRRKFGRR